MFLYFSYVGTFYGSDGLTFDVSLDSDNFNKTHLSLDTNVCTSGLDLSLRYGQKHLFVDSPGSCYINNTCGILGKYNKDQNDEFEMSNGKLTQNTDTFANSWWIYNNDENRDIVEEKCVPETYDSDLCNGDIKLLKKVKTQCNRLFYNEYDWCCDNDDDYDDCLNYAQNCISDTCMCLTSSDNIINVDRMIYKCLDLPRTTAFQYCHEPDLRRRRRTLE